MKTAECRFPESQEIFFGPIDEDKEVKSIRETVAGEICESCPVTVSCLEYALQRLPQGFAAGLNERERVKLKYQQRKSRE